MHLGQRCCRVALSSVSKRLKRVREGERRRVSSLGEKKEEKSGKKVASFVGHGGCFLHLGNLSEGVLSVLTLSTG